MPKIEWKKLEKVWKYCLYRFHEESGYTTLATINMRGKRFQWHAISNAFAIDVPFNGVKRTWNIHGQKQGHAKTLEEAKQIIESFWSYNA